MPTVDWGYGIDMLNLLYPKERGAQPTVSFQTPYTQDYGVTCQSGSKRVLRKTPLVLPIATLSKLAGRPHVFGPRMGSM